MSSSWLRIAHRGASGSAPELTRAAIARALDLGVDMIEVDVQVSRDGRLVVLHDSTLERTTNGRGLVRDKDWHELAELDAGSWFGPEFAAERLLDVDALLAMVGDRARLNIEIKAPQEDWPVLVPHLLERLELQGRLASTVISCFDLGALQAVRDASRAARLGVLWYLPDLEPAWAAVDALDAVSLHPYVGICDAGLFAEARRRGVETYVWTVNDIATMRRLIAAGASGVMTDHPDLFAELPMEGA